MEKSTMSAEQDVNRVMAVLKIIWMALLGSLALYVVVGRLAAPDLAFTVGDEAFRMLRIALYALGSATLLAAGYVRRLILGAGERSVGPDPDRRASLPQRYSSAVIASLAMSESIGIYGLVLFLLGKNATDLYLPAGISAAAMFYFRPRKDKLLDLCQGHEGQALK
jgi:F0F1-type ATP synthase membrane subunit c/vacuolar-type H+-ATPase subunit K